MPYELHLNPQQRAALKAAISFWEKKEVNDKATELFKSCENLKIWEAQSKWDEFTKTMINEWNRDPIPHELGVELIYIFKTISVGIFNWYQYIKNEFSTEELSIDWIDNIHWTPYGTVDIVETFKSYWLDNPNLNITKMYNFACTHMIEDHINDLWNKIPEDVQHDCYRDMYGRFDRHIIAYWQSCRDGDLPNLIRQFERDADTSNPQYKLEFHFIYDPDRSTEENMFRLSAHQGHYMAVKYFWEKLTEQERDESIIKCARIAVLCCYHYHNEHRLLEHYKINEYIEICIFLMNQMTDEFKKAFFNGELRPLELRFNGRIALDTRDEILRMLLSGWSWQKLFMPVLTDMIRLLDGNIMVCSFLDSITKKMSNDYLPGYSTEMSSYRSLLREVWLIIPGTVKQGLVRTDSPYSFISDLIDMWDIDTLKLILNDPEIAVVRDQYIDFGVYSYRNLIENDKLEILDKFLREIFDSEEEINRFKKRMNLISSFIVDGDYNSANKFLDLVCNTPEEKQFIKKIEFDAIFEDLIGENDIKILNKLLDWTFETEEEKKHPKNRLKNHMQIMNWIWYTWMDNKTNVDKSKDESSQFLHWLYESEEEIALCKRELFDSEKNQLNMYMLGKLNEEAIMKDLLSWCELPQEGVQRIEQALSQQNQEL